MRDAAVVRSLAKGRCQVTRTFDAVFANGVFRPLAPVPDLHENARVQITLSGDATLPERPFADWVGTLPDDEAREMIRTIEEEFERVDPDEWK